MKSSENEILSSARASPPQTNTKIRIRHKRLGNERQNHKSSRVKQRHSSNEAKIKQRRNNEKNKKDYNSNKTTPPPVEYAQLGSTTTLEFRVRPHPPTR